MKKLIIIFIISLTILIIIITGCLTKPILNNDDEVMERGSNSLETSVVSEIPDIELFNKYFSYIQMGGTRGFFGNKDASRTFLFLRGGSMSGGFKEKNPFHFKIAVFDLNKNNYTERYFHNVPALGSDGFAMEILEWNFLSSGSYEYRVFVEDKLVAILPFEIISLLEYYIP